MSSTDLTTEDLPDLLRRLNSVSVAIRTAAFDEARCLSPERLLELARLEATNYRQRLRKISLFFIPLAVVWVCLILFGFFEIGEEWRVYERLIGVMSVIVILYRSVSRLFVPRRARKKISQLLTYAEDPLLLPSMLSLMAEKETDAEVKGIICWSLKTLLPKLRADQASVFTPQQRKALAQLLSSAYQDVDLTLAVLKALEQIGDEQAVEFVLPLAEEPEETETSLRIRHIQERRIEKPGPRSIEELKRVREAARACLPYLRQNTERFRLSDTLLRPSSAESVTASTELLRPASHTDTVPPDQLLRATNQPQQD